MSASINQHLNARTRYVDPTDLQPVLDAALTDLANLRTRLATVISEMEIIKNKLNTDSGVAASNFAFTNTTPVALELKK